MKNIWTIAKKEYNYYFISPIAYVVAFAILIVLGVFFAFGLQQFQQYSFQDLSSYLNTTQITGLFPFLFIFAIPALTMRLISDENRMGTMELLLTSPIRDWELIVGKWLGAFLFVLSIIFISLIYPIILNKLVSPHIDYQQLASSYLGVVLVAAALLGLGVGISALFTNQIAAFIATWGLFVVLYWIVGIPASVIQSGADVFNYLSINTHFGALNQGTINLSDIVYLLSLTVLGLFIGITAIDVRRWQ
jgi:ABC-2 type transport system permease protein